MAGVLVGVAASLVAVLLWHRRSALARTRLRYVLAAVFLAAFAAAAALIYFVIGSRHSLESHVPQASARAGDAAPPAPVSSMDAAIASLEARLARSGGSDADWNLLAQAYDFQGRGEDARRARAHIAGAPAGTVTQMSAAALVAAATAAGAASGTSERNAVIAPPASLAELQQRVQKDPRDAPSWLALADLRRTQHDNSRARAAVEKVIALHAMTAQSWADYADVLASLAGGSLGGVAGRAIDNALALDPSNLKALWLKASQAHEQGRYAEALGWWNKLRAALPPDSADVRIIDSNIAEDSQLAGLTPSSQAASGAVAPLTAAPPPAAAGAVQVAGTVSIDSSLAARVPADATLFIYAKAADSPGAPLAVLRTTAANWPVRFQLDDSMAMIATRRLSQFDRVLIEARVSRSGQATPASGDLYVTSAVLRPLDGQKLALVINREIP
jgi:cytochrome c-type biogenesis protein CcmH